MSLDTSNLTDRKAAGFIAGLDEAFCICEIVVDSDGTARDYRVLETNPAFASVTGIERAEGRTALELLPTLEPIWVARYADVALNRKAQRFRQKIAALARDFDVYAAPLDPPGHFAALLRDITEDRRARARQDAALARARELLDELNHRVMNSLSMISSIVSLEARKHRKTPAARPLIEVRDRVHALATLYKTLNTAGSEDRVQADLYLHEILRGLESAVADGRIAITSRIEPVDLTTRTAVPVGLIVNELVTNALKYAFVDRDRGTIHVDLRRAGDGMCLRVRDDGIGIAPGGVQGNGTGGRLIPAFVSQLNGDSQVDSAPGGTTVTVRFPLAADAGAARDRLSVADAG